MFGPDGVLFYYDNMLNPELRRLEKIEFGRIQRARRLAEYTREPPLTNKALFRKHELEKEMKELLKDGF